MKNLKLVIYIFLLNIQTYASEPLTQTPFPIDTPILTTQSETIQARLEELASTHKTVYVYIWDRLQLSQSAGFAGHAGLRLADGDEDRYVSLWPSEASLGYQKPGWKTKSPAAASAGVKFGSMLRGMPQERSHERLFWQRIKDAPIQDKADQKLVNTFKRDYDYFNACIQGKEVSGENPRLLEALPAWVLPLHLTEDEYRKLQAALELVKAKSTTSKLFWSACGYPLIEDPEEGHFNCASFVLWLLNEAGLFSTTTHKFFMPDNLKLLMADHLKQKLDLRDLTLEQCASLYTLKLGEVEGDVSLPPLVTSMRSLWQQRYAQMSYSYHEWCKIDQRRQRAGIDCFDCYQPMYCEELYQDITTQLLTKIKGESGKRAIIIKGNSGSGKTAMGKYLAYKVLQEDESYKAIHYIDASTPWEDVNGKFGSQLTSKKCLILVDNINQQNKKKVAQELLDNIYDKLGQGVVIALTRVNLNTSQLSIDLNPVSGDIKDLNAAPLTSKEAIDLFKTTLIQTQSIPKYARRRFREDEDVVLGLFGVEKSLIQELPQNPLDIVFAAHYIVRTGINLRDYIECRKDINTGSVSAVKDGINYQGQLLHERIANLIDDQILSPAQMKWLLMLGLIKGESIAIDKFLDGDTSRDFRKQLKELGIIQGLVDANIKISKYEQNLILEYLKAKLTDGDVIKTVLTKFKTYLEEKINLKSREEIEQGQQHAHSFINQFWKLGDLDFVDSFHDHGLNTIANWEAFLNSIVFYKDKSLSTKIKLDFFRSHPQIRLLLYRNIEKLDHDKVTIIDFRENNLAKNQEELSYVKNHIIKNITTLFPYILNYDFADYSLLLRGCYNFEYKAGPEIFFEYLQRCKPEKVDLSMEKIDSLIAARLGRNLKHLPNLLSLSLGNTLGSGMQIIAENFKYTPNLRSLSFSCSNIGYFGLKALSENLKHIPNLESLSINNESISCKGLELLIKNIAYIPKLKHLSLINCKIKNESLIIIAKNFKYLRELRTLWLENNKYDHLAVKDIIANLDYLDNLQILDIDLVDRCTALNLLTKLTNKIRLSSLNVSDTILTVKDLILLFKLFKRHKYLTNLYLGSAINLVDYIPTELLHLFTSAEALSLKDGQILIRCWLQNNPGYPVVYTSLAIPKYDGEGKILTDQPPINIGLVCHHVDGEYIQQFASSYDDDSERLDAYKQVVILISGIASQMIYRCYLENRRLIDEAHLLPSKAPSKLRWHCEHLWVINRQFQTTKPHTNFTFIYALLKEGGIDSHLPQFIIQQFTDRVPMFNITSVQFYYLCLYILSSSLAVDPATSIGEILSHLISFRPQGQTIERNPELPTQSTSIVRYFQSGQTIGDFLAANSDTHPTVKTILKITSAQQIRPIMESVLLATGQSLRDSVMVRRQTLSTPDYPFSLERQAWLIVWKPARLRVTEIPEFSVFAEWEFEEPKKIAARIILDLRATRIATMKQQALRSLLQSITRTVELDFPVVEEIYQEWLRR